MQEKMRKLVEESSKKKKEKKKQKDKDKGGKRIVSNSSSLGKPGAHGALTKTNSIITDSVDDSIASVVSGADLKVGPDIHHPTGGKSLNMHHTVAAGANAASKPPKSKGEPKLNHLFACFYFCACCGLSFCCFISFYNQTIWDLYLK